MLVRRKFCGKELKMLWYFCAEQVVVNTEEIVRGDVFQTGNMVLNLTNDDRVHLRDKGDIVEFIAYMKQLKNEEH